MTRAPKPSFSALRARCGGGIEPMAIGELDGDNLPPTTIPPTLTLTAIGFGDPALARELGRAVIETITLLGSFMNLAKLDGVTLAVDYDAAIAGLDRGLEGLRPLDRTNTEEMQGVAMSPAVMRDGDVRTHLLFDAAMLIHLILPEASDEERSAAIGIIAHECAHVEITSQKEAAIPGARFGTPIEGYERAIMFQVAEVCWDEYAACRISAPFAHQQNIQHASTTKACLETARVQANAAIRSYRIHGNIDRLVAEAGPPLCRPVKAAAYLLGGMDGEELGWDAFDEIRQAAERSDYWPLFDRLHAILRDLWDGRESWSASLTTFEPLEHFAKAVFASGGLHFRSRGDGTCRIDVPFTVETIF